MSKFSNIRENIVNPNDEPSLTIQQPLTSDDLKELFNNEDVKKVYSLSLIDCRITKIPESIINLTSMRELFLNYNNITTLPSNLGKMNLIKLNLTGNDVTVNEHNFNILQQVYNNTPPTSTRKNAAHVKIIFDNEDRRESYFEKVEKKKKNESIRVIGNLDLVKLANGNERPRNKHVLLQSDFVKLYRQIREPEPVPIAASPLPEIQQKPTSLRKTKQNKKARNTKVSSSSSSSSSGYEPSSSESSASSKPSYASSSSSSSSRKNKRSTKKK